MNFHLKSFVGGTCVKFVVLCVILIGWESTYKASGFFFLGPILVACIVCYAAVSLSLERRNAVFRMISISDTFFLKVLIGGLVANLKIIVISLASMFILLGDLATRGNSRAIFALLAIAIAALMKDFLVAKRFARLKQPFLLIYSIRAALITMSLLLIPLLAILDYHTLAYPEAYRGLSLGQALATSTKNLPKHYTLFSEYLSWVYTFEAFKIWTVNQLGGLHWYKYILVFENSITLSAWLYIGVIFCGQWDGGRRSE